MKSIRLNLDALGVCASTLCMIHCLAFPLLLAVLPLWSLSATAQNSGAALAATDELPAANARPSEAAGCVDRDCCPESAAGALSGAASLPVTSALPAGDAGEHAGCCSTPTDFWIHVGLLATVAPLGLIAWGAGYRRHRRMGVLGLGLAGVLLLCAALLFGQHLLGGRGEQVMTVLGSICMVSAHLWNRRQCRCCRTPDIAHVLEIESVSHPKTPGNSQVSPEPVPFFHRRFAKITRSLCLAASIMTLCASVSGCGPAGDESASRAPRVVHESAVPVVSATELRSLVQRSPRPVLVEFGVNFGCFRCDEMRPRIALLAGQLEDRAEVVRVDFNANRQLAAELGAEICPSYVLFDRGRVVATRNYPTSTDLLLAELDSISVIEGGR